MSYHNSDVFQPNFNSSRNRSKDKGRRVSMAITTSKATAITRKSVPSSVISDSIPLSIAERFMSIKYSPGINTVQEEKNNSSNNNNEDGGGDDGNFLNTSTTFTPGYPLFSSFDHRPEVYDVSTLHPQDNNNSPSRKTRKKVNCRSYCKKKHKHGNNRKSKTALQKRKHDKHAKNNIIAIAMPEENKETLPEKNQSASGLWIGNCCFIHCGKGDTQRSLLPITASSKKQTRNKNANKYCCCGRRAWVIITFLVVVIAAVLAFFFWPRIPLIRIEGAINTIPTKVTQTQQGGRTSNVAFESTWLLNITMDNRRNYFTTRFNRIQIIAKDSMTGMLIGKGLNNNMEAGIVFYLPGREISTVQLPISVNYQARDTTDATFSNLIRACNTNSTVDSSHHSLSIHFWFTLYIFGLDWLGYKPTLIATPATGGFFCPSSLSTIMY